MLVLNTDKSSEVRLTHPQNSFHSITVSVLILTYMFRKGYYIGKTYISADEINCAKC